MDIANYKLFFLLKLFSCYDWDGSLGSLPLKEEEQHLLWSFRLSPPLIENDDNVKSSMLSHLREEGLCLYKESLSTRNMRAILFLYKHSNLGNK